MSAGLPKSVTFSIAMPVLNGEEFISEAISSIRAQTYKDFELFIVDGGSTDDTLKIIEAFASKDVRIKLIHLPGSGIYDAIFAAFSQANGRILSWLNSDDLYVPWALASVMNVMDRDKLDWVTGLPSIFDSNGLMRCVYPHPPMPKWLIKRGACHFQGLGCIQAESTFFSAVLFQKLSEQDRKIIKETRLAGDFLLWKFFANYERLHQLPTVLGGFRIHGKNMSITGNNTYMKEVIASGALRLPRRVANVLRRSLVYASAYRLQKKSENENTLLNKSIDRQ